MRTRLMLGIAGLVLLSGVAQAVPLEERFRNPADEAKPSVLFVNVDDWNDWNEVLQGHPQAITPNITRLAERGVTFSNAICASPSCVPSRPALFTGIAPSRSGNISNDSGKHPWRFYVGPDAVTIPKLFSQNGWKSIGIAKNFHKGDGPEFDTYIPPFKTPKKLKKVGIKLNSSAIWDVADMPVSEMGDYRAASAGIEEIQSNREPLFLSLGIYRPHVPWIVPQAYFDKYPLEGLQLSERRADDLDDLPERFKLVAGFEAKFGKGYHKSLVEKGYDKQFVRAYLASVTFADEQLGRVLDAWYASAHAKTGYVVLWSDHGYMLGEKGAWSKLKPWYDSSRSNLIIAGPGLPEGAVCRKAVSLLDVYPTLVELLGLPKPPQTLDGNSLVPLLKDPNADWDRPVRMTGQMDGVFFESVLSNDYRMTRLITGETELYKLSDDPHEFENLAPNPEYAQVIKKLAKHLSFRYPEIPADGWIEAEAIPAQTSADYRLRGNCHYTQALLDASGGRVVCADLRAGAGSYLDFVLDVPTPGTYALSATLSAGGACTVWTDSVKNEAAQADAGYPMTKVGTIAGGPQDLETVAIGALTWKVPGLKLVRIESNIPKQSLKIDRIRIVESDKAIGSQPEGSVVKTPAPPAQRLPGKGTPRKKTWGSKEEWDRDKPTVSWVFAFVDKNGDGKIDSDEYEALQEYKRTHGKQWRPRARKELGLAD